MGYIDYSEKNLQGPEEVSKELNTLYAAEPLCQRPLDCHI
jgi:hypothetical protein